MQYPLGIEVRPENQAFANRLYADGLITHVQISAPTLWAPDELKLLSSTVPRCVHSTYLNTLGKNDWGLLKAAEPIVRSLHPFGVVEHFGTFIQEDGTKTAVAYDSLIPDSKVIQTAIRQLHRWQALLEIPVYLENLPIVKGADRTFGRFVRSSTNRACRRRSICRILFFHFRVWARISMI